MENPTLGIRCRIVARIPTGIHRFDGNSHKIRSDSYRIRVGPVVGLNLLGDSKLEVVYSLWNYEKQNFIPKSFLSPSTLSDMSCILDDKFSVLLSNGISTPEKSNGWPMKNCTVSISWVSALVFL